MLMFHSVQRLPLMLQFIRLRIQFQHFGIFFEFFFGRHNFFIDLGCQPTLDLSFRLARLYHVTL
jgi:hypothetical protein